MNRHIVLIAALCLTTSSVAASASAKSPVPNYAARAEASCVAQYRGAHPTGRSTAGQQAYVSSCVRNADVQQPQYSAREERSCIAQYRADKAKGRPNQGQAAYVSACTKS